MPSPLGHTLGGIAVGLIAVRSLHSAGVVREHSAIQPRSLAVLLAAASCAPDLDLLVGRHSAESHSVGAVVVAGMTVLCVLRSSHVAGAAALAYASHLLFDWLGHDTAPPLGIMALWPFSEDYFQAPVKLLPAVVRDIWAPGFWHSTWRMVLHEMVLFGPPAMLAWHWRMRPRVPRPGLAASSVPQE